MWRSGQALRPYFDDVAAIVKHKASIPTLRQHIGRIVDYDELAFVHFPIRDCGITDDDRVLELARELVKDIAERKIIYLHCWGGHGRTGTLVCIMLHLMYGLDPVESMNRCQLVHDLRQCPVVVGSPQTQTQRDQVTRVITKLMSQSSYNRRTLSGGNGAMIGENSDCALSGVVTHGSPRPVQTPTHPTHSTGQAASTAGTRSWGDASNNHDKSQYTAEYQDPQGLTALVPPPLMHISHNPLSAAVPISDNQGGELAASISELASVHELNPSHSLSFQDHTAYSSSNYLHLSQESIGLTDESMVGILSPSSDYSNSPALMFAQQEITDVDDDEGSRMRLGSDWVNEDTNPLEEMDDEMRLENEWEAVQGIAAVVGGDGLRGAGIGSSTPGRSLGVLVPAPSSPSTQAQPSYTNDAPSAEYRSAELTTVIEAVAPPSQGKPSFRMQWIGRKTT